MKPYARIFLTAVKDTAEKSTMMRAMLNALFTVHNKDALLIGLDKSEDTVKYLVDRICELRAEYLESLVKKEKTIGDIGGIERGDNNEKEEENSKAKEENNNTEATEGEDGEVEIKSKITRILEKSENDEK